MRTVRKEKAKKQAGPRRNTRVSAFPLLGPGAKAVDVVGIGENSLDTLVDLERFPEPDSKHLTGGATAMVGGQVATAMVGTARLGLRSRYVGAVGADDAGRLVRRVLRQEGVDTRIVVREGAATRGAIILIERRSGRRTVLEHRDERLPLRKAELVPSVVTGGRVLLVDARDPALSEAAARIAHAAGVPVVLDVEHVRPGLDRLLRCADVIVCTATFPRAKTGQTVMAEGLRRLAAMSRGPVVVATLGARGSIAWVRGAIVRSPGFRVPVVDTTGAGDAFRAGLIAAWLRAGADDPVDDIFRYANAVAALNCMGFGAQTALPTARRVSAFVTAHRHAQSK